MCTRMLSFCSRLKRSSAVNNIFSQLAESFSEGSLAGDCPYG